MGNPVTGCTPQSLLTAAASVPRLARNGYTALIFDPRYRHGVNCALPDQELTARRPCLAGDGREGEDLGVREAIPWRG